MDIKSMFMRLVDNLKSRNITGLFTTLTLGGEALEETDLAISSLIDTWILLRVIETDDIRNRGVYILKSRGMAHSNRIRNFLLTDHGVELVDA
jgi:circadian clock protein KaiC